MATLANGAAETATSAPPYDLVIITDATASMGEYLDSLNDSLPQILHLSEMTSAFESIGVLAYRDYGEDKREIMEWSGWHTRGGNDSVDLFSFAKSLSPIGGDDYPEAAKSAVAKLISELNPNRRTLAIWYCDAPPHIGEESRSWGGNKEKEIKALKQTDIGKSCLDWVTACKKLRQHNVQVLTLLEGNMQIHESYYVMLARATGGTTVRFKKAMNSRDISLATMELLLAFLDQHRDTNTNLVETINYRDVADFDQIKGEKPGHHGGFLPLGGNEPVKGLKHVPFNEKHVRRRVGQVFDFAKRFQEDLEYQATVYKSLVKIIESDVTAISLNPIFGELWRVVCKDRLSDERTVVVNAFSNAVSKLPAGASKDDMTKWLEESYDSTRDIEEIIAKVDETAKYPAVCVDPTESAIGSDHWVRGDLLEVGRSCYGGVLKRLAAILSKDLVFIENEASCPSHLKDDAVVPKLPFALVQKQYGRAFWKILLHLILPGTMLTARAGNVLAALSIKLGIPFLKNPASEALLAWKGKWRDIDTAENFTIDLMQLLTSVNDIGVKEGKPYLDDVEASIFRTLVDYKFAEKNLDTELKARIPFTPEKTIGWAGPTVKCKGPCGYMRSVTLMGTGKDKDKCGICLWKPANDEEAADKQKRITLRAGDENLPWVECGQSDCRAGYVVYDIEALNVKPKCHYHRTHRNLPKVTARCEWVECKKCTNRVIWPEEYRDGREKDFLCVFCEEGRESIVDAMTTASCLIKENGAEWILGKNGAEKVGFKGRSVYAVVKEVSIDTVYTFLRVLADDQPGPKLLKHKPIQNVAEVKAEFATWVREGRIETKTCNLCFESKFKPQDLLPACGRKGCTNKVDNECLREWYGQNKPGSIIHLNALGCPFDRRLPSPKVLSKYSGIWAISNLKQAMEDKSWIYGWCASCSTAKKFMERVCAGGAPPELRDWKCEDCSTIKAMRARECPKCGIPTEKMSGCNHIHCTIQDCDTHWCWQCGGAFEGGRIYEHMYEEHGGIFGDGVDDDGEEDFEY